MINSHNYSFYRIQFSNIMNIQLFQRNHELTIRRHFFRWSKWYPSRHRTIGTDTMLPFRVFGATLVIR